MVKMKLCVGNMLRFCIISWKHSSGHELVSNKSPFFTHDFFLRPKRFHIQLYNLRPARSQSLPRINDSLLADLAHYYSIQSSEI